MTHLFTSTWQTIYGDHILNHKPICYTGSSWKHTIRSRSFIMEGRWGVNVLAVPGVIHAAIHPSFHFLSLPLLRRVVLPLFSLYRAHPLSTHPPTSPGLGSLCSDVHFLLSLPPTDSEILPKLPTFKELHPSTRAEAKAGPRGKTLRLAHDGEGTPKLCGYHAGLPGPHPTSLCSKGPGVGKQR